MNRLVCEFPDKIVRSRSSTTRKPRGEEQAGVDYDFLSREEFEACDDFLESAEIYGNLYGTRKSVVEKELDQDKHVVLVIDTQGAMKVKERVEATFIFISPPSREELERRLKSRMTESDEAIAKRLEWSFREMEMMPHYDYQIVNDDLDVAYQEFRSIFIAEEHKVDGTNK